MPLDTALVKKMAKTQDIALITLGRNSGEFHDRQVDGDFTLSAAEQNMIDKVSSALVNRYKLL